VEWCSNLYFPLLRVRGTWGAEQAITSRLVSQNLFSSSVRGEQRAGICSVCGSSLGILCFVVCIIISLIIRFCMSVYTAMVF